MFEVLHTVVALEGRLGTPVASHVAEDAGPNQAPHRMSLKHTHLPTDPHIRLVFMEGEYYYIIVL